MLDKFDRSFLKRSILQRSLGLSFLVCAGFCGAAESQYQTFETIEKNLHALATQHADRIHLEVVGKSAGGRKLYLVQIADKASVSPEKRPALFLAANAAGYHNAGSEAALHLIDTLANTQDKKLLALLTSRTLYIAPVVNPDAHNGLFAHPRQLGAGNDSDLDRDLDGLIAEDGADDLDGNGIITQMRMKDASGDMMIDPDDARRMIKADPTKGQRGNYRVYLEGKDDDKDGLYNEDGLGGVHVDKNFPAGFPVADTEAGKWPGIAPETKAIMDAVIAHRNIALAIVYGPANQLLAPPKGYERPTPAGAKPSDEANRPEADDLKVLSKLAESYKKALDTAGLDSKRNARQTGPGSFSNWLYFHFGVPTIELDVWGIPKAKSNSSSSDPSAIASTSTSKDKTKTDNPAQNNTNGDHDKDVMAYVDAYAPSAFTPWKTVTLADGIKAEVGGLDAFVEYAPEMTLLKPAIAVHTEQVLQWASQLAELEIIETKVQSKGDDLYLISVVGAMRGSLPTHSKLATRMKNKLPVRLELKLGKGVTTIAQNRAVVSERLEPGSSLKAEWLVHGAKGSKLDVALWTYQAGQVRRTITLGQEN